jgi:hypothetical protein
MADPLSLLVKSRTQFLPLYIIISNVFPESKGLDNPKFDSIELNVISRTIALLNNAHYRTRVLPDLKPVWPFLTGCVNFGVELQVSPLIHFHCIGTEKILLSSRYKIMMSKTNTATPADGRNLPATIEKRNSLSPVNFKS